MGNHNMKGTDNDTKAMYHCWTNHRGVSQMYPCFFPYKRIGKSSTSGVSEIHYPVVSLKNTTGMLKIKPIECKCCTQSAMPPQMERGSFPAEKLKKQWARLLFIPNVRESTIEKVDDMANVVNASPPLTKRRSCSIPQIVAVTHLTTQKTWIRWVEENVNNSTLMRCSLANCMLQQKAAIRNTHTSAKLMFTYNSLFVT